MPLQINPLLDIFLKKEKIKYYGALMVRRNT
jgi:hypothetical protein